MPLEKEENLQLSKRREENKTTQKVYPVYASVKLLINARLSPQKEKRKNLNETTDLMTRGRRRKCEKERGMDDA